MLKKNLLRTLIIICLFFLITIPVFASKYGLDEAAAETTLSKTPLITTIGNGIATVLSFLGIVFFGLLIYAGFNWMTARGNTEKSSSALNTIIDALIGIIIILSAYVATNFVFDSLKPANISIPTTSSCTDKGPGWACRSIFSCGLETATTDVNEARKVCETNSDKCALNLCAGGLDNVCCNSGAVVPVPDTETKCYTDCGANFNSCLAITTTTDGHITEPMDKGCMGATFTDGDCPTPCGGSQNLKGIGEPCEEETDCYDELSCQAKSLNGPKTCLQICTTPTDCVNVSLGTCSLKTENGNFYCTE
ncbi:MAG: hypothetical protein US42_C0009G0038 [Candidatus Magasanikbacteria bacterium GW2011_GWC2_37_14]|uniref:Uncharacterized protein n=1 Tax=Candidatus Magasanikbacteria bacterium GW2011_GWC2_37_14 TaxID=1619046 RepID=A0A0G0G8M8_9BACT|nr:MAG: hypothetical protein US42_C0009G0038 [Candidatus Magasanikbacteria bacterium GW2011_GWC2_37_14]